MTAIDIFNATVIYLIAMLATSYFNNETGNGYTVKLEDRVINKDAKFIKSTMIFVKDVTSEAMTIVKGVPLSFILDLLKVDRFSTYIIIDRAGKII